MEKNKTNQAIRRNFTKYLNIVAHLQFDQNGLGFAFLFTILHYYFIMNHQFVMINLYHIISELNFWLINLLIILTRTKQLFQHFYKSIF